MKTKKLSIKQFLKYLVPNYVGKKRFNCPAWPADVFAIAAALLEKSGGYTLLGTELCPFISEGFTGGEQRIDCLSELGREWRSAWARALKKSPTLDAGGAMNLKLVRPTQLNDWWRTLSQRKNNCVSSIKSDQTLLAALINMVALADESLSLVGLKIHSDKGRFWNWCGKLVEPDNDKGSTLCIGIDSSRLRVLPKSQTPAGGLSIRSLTHYLSLCPPIDIPAFWFSGEIADDLIDDNHCNLLLVPWPFEIFPSQFVEFMSTHPLSHDRAKRFAFDHGGVSGSRKKGELIRAIESLLEKAERQIGRVHMIVLPELSVSQSQYERLRDTLLERNLMLVAGVLADSHAGTAKKNVAMVAAPGNGDNRYVEYHQQKHHRWKLDESQIVRYGLASQLDPYYEWWEGIEVDERKINFMRPKPWLSLCVLLCEDLAQYDPVGRFVRAVAPDMVISLLMDGPQLESRWPARYATVLADDPGSAVLTLTSLGMNNLSRRPENVGQSVPRTIALWKDPIAGATKIELPGDKEAAILTVRRTEIEKWTADGRPNDLKFGTPTFGGIQFV